MRLAISQGCGSPHFKCCEDPRLGTQPAGTSGDNFKVTHNDSSVIRVFMEAFVLLGGNVRQELGSSAQQPFICKPQYPAEHELMKQQNDVRLDIRATLCFHHFIYSCT